MTKRPIIVLDLDETLINSEYVKGFDIKKYGKKMKLFRMKKMYNDFFVFERPKLQEFLDLIFENFDVAIWTAASKEYALWIIKNILRAGTDERPLKHIFFDYHCKASDEISHRKKNLKILSEIFGLTDYDMDSIVIIDDNREVYKTQPKNCISIKEFQFKDEGSENDDELGNITILLKEIIAEYNQ